MTVAVFPELPMPGPLHLESSQQPHEAESGIHLTDGKTKAKTYSLTPPKPQGL